MLSFPLKARIFLARQPVDFRKGFDGLASIVSTEFHEDPYTRLMDDLVFPEECFCP